MSDKLFAHSRPANSEETWEPLEKHLNEVADLAANFAKPFGGEEVARIAGLLHDLGKAKPGFQAYLRGERGSEPHATAGAKFCAEKYGSQIGQMLAYSIAGHHAGLANGIGEGVKLTSLFERLKKETDPRVYTPNWLWLAIPDKPQKPPGPFATPMTGAKDEQAFACAFFIRMIFSCLVDADFLATEAFYAGAEGREVERGWTGNLKTLKQSLDKRMENFGPPETEVDRLRAEVLTAARACAPDEPGLFTLTVPTGGGKTLASLSFALDHAIKHDLRRVIYVIPFTSIIEQTASEFRKALKDDDAILEHHSSFDWDGLTKAKKSKDDDDEGPDGIEKLRLAAQNWDRPIIVTTAVQFFESLFANRTSRSRKLHNLAKSVIVLDEAQTLPLKFLRPCLAVLRELARGYGSSVVLCTATQPAILKEDGFKSAEALSKDCPVLPVREIAPDPVRLYQSLKRVRVTDAGPLGDGELLRRLQTHDQVLCIVNNRTHARELFDALKGAGAEGATHLSTTMTAMHRRDELRDIRARLKAAQPVRLVSTSLVEAGVDISFPFVYRAVAGIDSIAQAAGRCNRNGELGPDGGQLFVFDPGDATGRRPPRELKQFAETAAAVMRKHPDPLTLEAVRAYFGELFWRGGLERLDGMKVGSIQGVMKALGEGQGRLEFPFESIAHGFNLIETAMVPVIIPATGNIKFGAPSELIGNLRSWNRVGSLARKLQQFLVNIPVKSRSTLVGSGAAEIIREKDFGDQFVLLANTDLYEAHRGLDWGEPTYRNAESLVL
ncbi:MAG: CRISPR-associated helicase Cas3' [Alphaproteobacteria bacterium]|nr:CRISPR-associated helicase Cas3' [Alphaproteobacteria bacterium]